jgi:mono/diheme cytochrome c family protein
MTFIAFVMIATSCSAIAQDLTGKERRSVKSIASAIDRAGRQYKSKKFESSAEYFHRALALLTEASTNASPAMLDALKPEHARLAKAQELLTEQGLDAAQVPALPEPMKAGDEDAVSFRNNVVPIITAKCGRCHVQGNRGRFSAATFDSLMDSGHVDAGMPDVSRLIEVIEDGDMPPGGSLLDAELETLKTWIKQGAKADVAGDQNIGRIAGGAVEPNDTPALKVTMATGKETISFANDIAPVLVENCSGCHVDVRNNASGGLNMTNFAQLLRGGDAGAMFTPGKGLESLLVKKLLGTGGGNRMPQGRGPLSEETIQKFTVWINEGARFDGGAPTIGVRTVAARAKAASLSHEELTTERKKLTASKWKMVMSDIAYNSSETDDLFVVSSYDQERVDSIAETAQGLMPKIKAVLETDKSAPLVKGKVTLYVFERRYDFNEFGVMIEGGEIPKSFNNRWGFDTINAYVAMLMTRNIDVESREVDLGREISATYVASMAPDVPRWFANGMGYWVASRVFKRSDAVDEWETQAETAAEQMDKPDDFLAGRLRSDLEGLVGYYFVKRLKSANAGQFNRLLEELKSDKPFAQSFQGVYGMSPAEYVGVKKK